MHRAPPIVSLHHRRAYSEKKLSDNVEAEIMQVILDEAREAYREEIVIELPSNTIEDVRLIVLCISAISTMYLANEQPSDTIEDVRRAVIYIT